MFNPMLNPGGTGGLDPPKIWSKTIFLEITIIFLERKKPPVAGLETNAILCYCNKPQPLSHGVKCKLTSADGRYFCKKSGFYHLYKIKKLWFLSILQDKNFLSFYFLQFSIVLFLKTEHEIKRELTVILFDLFTNLFTYISIICLLHSFFL